MDTRKKPAQSVIDRVLSNETLVDRLQANLAKATAILERLMPIVQKAYQQATLTGKAGYIRVDREGKLWNCEIGSVTEKEPDDPGPNQDP